jgi:iron complex outermembrane receptor protein
LGRGRSKSGGTRRLWALALAIALAPLPAAGQDPEAPRENASPAAGETPAAADGSDSDADSESGTDIPDEPALEPTGDIEEIIVTGERGADELQDVPISATTFDSEELKSLRIQNIGDVADYTPNLEINTAFAASNPTLFIRGIGLKDYNANAAGAVAVYQDGININSPAIQLFQFFDVRNVEILRGPQGSLNGRNATAGAIMVNSMVPDGEFGATGSFTYGNFNTLQVEGAVNVPLIQEKLSARLAFTANFRDGNTENQCADWDPVAQGFAIEALAQNGIVPVVNQAAIEDSYAQLGAHPGIPDASEPTGFRAVKVRRVRDLAGPFGPTVQERQERFVYLDTVFARELSDGGVSEINRGPNPDGDGVTTTSNRWELDEDLPGTPFRVGDPVGLQEDRFSFNDSAADQMCILKAPGSVVTSAGANTELIPGEFLRTSGIPALEDFQGLKHRINDVNNWAGRGILKYNPLDNMEWILNAHGGQNRSDSRHLQMLGANAKAQLPGFDAALEQDIFSEASSAQVAANAGLSGFEGVRSPIDGIDATNSFSSAGGDDPFKGWYNRDGKEILDAWGVNLRGSWEVGTTSLTSLTGYEWYDRFVEDEGDANPLDSFPAEWSDSAWQVSQEFRADGQGERYSWGAGLFFLYESLLANNLFPDTRQREIQQSFDQTLWSIAPYVSGRYEFTEALSLEAGVRYNVEHKDFALQSTVVSTAEGGSEVNEIPEDKKEATWAVPTGDVTLAYAPDWDVLTAARIDFVNFYAKYAHGFKGGHFNAGLTLKTKGNEEQEIKAVEPEFIDSIEIGWKSRWFDERMVLNLAAFRYWYKDLQVFDIVNEAGALPLQQLLNADARVLGLEVEFQARPVSGLFMQAGFGWLHSEFEDFVVTKAVSLGPRGDPVEEEFVYTGNPLIAAPNYNLSGIVEYVIPLMGFGSLVPQYDFSYRSKIYLDPQKLDPISQEPYWLHNARLAYRTENEKIEVAGWVRNITDQQYKVDVFDVSREFSTILEVWGDPRTYGVTLTYLW